MRDSVNRTKVFEIGWGSVGRARRITGRPKLFRSEIHEDSFGTSLYIVPHVLPTPRIMKRGRGWPGYWISSARAISRHGDRPFLGAAVATASPIYSLIRTLQWHHELSAFGRNWAKPKFD